MPKSVGFVILSHQNPAGVLRLIDTLNRLYDFPPIACHHDWRQTSSERPESGKNVSFVSNPVRTGWGRWSVVEATLSALQLLYSKGQPDWFYVLSGTDYPVVPGRDAVSDLEERACDAFIDGFALDAALAGNIPAAQLPLLNHHRTPGNVQIARTRYLTATIRIPILRLSPPSYSTSAQSFPRLGAHTISLPFSSWRSPFGPSFKCYVGSQWFTANARVAHRLLSPTEKDKKLQTYLRGRVVPDECYFQTVILNDKQFKTTGETYRYLNWRSGGAHPEWISADQVPEIISSGAHFARKLEADSASLDILDKELGIRADQRSF
ncbi:hypothetical protein G7A66_04380 [Altererythrobacter sp. SALINAS58]|uniref:beta-1,6-N-acetylglucosaminyltransferase n=1 Tax=Alteripontixanthobacter muriae TaxID=2705546 RepID=UPI001576A4A3|nr:beta-1,6-N-acetylglucosaminyltransferase [Alteripontixanthobacter muriae]NTZ42341.1 hypothetical protein [Alteripontixanthobacter muriae]